MMKKLLTSTLVVFIFISIFGFKTNNSIDFIGTYGVRDNDPSQIELVLNKDFTYTYQDFSRSSKKIELSGNWEIINKNTVFLKSDVDISFHQKWKIVADGQKAKSRNGLSFYTLSKK